MKNWLVAHFEVQNGMFFDTVFTGNGMTYYGSSIIKDSIWNYGTIDLISDANISCFLVFCKKIDKPCNLYVTKDEALAFNKLLVDNGFVPPLNDGELITETWMSFKEKKYKIKQNFDIRLVQSLKQQEDFLDVFVSAYGGEKKADKPYGDLPDEYTKCVLNSFEQKKFFNFVCYHNDIPVSIASLCFSDGKGGIYNVGTKPQYEKKGFGKAVTDACINQWRNLGGKILFLQTETGTGIDDWYEKLGFVRVFDGVVYEKS